jgi:hypothetical protein
MPPCFRFRAILALGSFVCAGCHGPMESRVTARSALSYATWSFRVQSEIDPAAAPLLRQAETEIKLHLMATAAATGAEGVEAAFLKAADGLTLRQLLQLGVGRRIDRLKDDQVQYSRNLAQTERVRARDGDRLSADYLVAARAEDRTDLIRTEKDLAEAQAQLVRVNSLP